MGKTVHSIEHEIRVWNREEQGFWVVIVHREDCEACQQELPV